MVEGEGAEDQQVAPLADAEWLCRLIYEPDHVDADGEISPSAISISDLRKSGFSVNREFVTAELMSKLAELQMSTKPNDREAAWVTKLLTGDVRRVKAVVDKQPQKGVAPAPVPELLLFAKESPQPADPPLPANPAHAHILSIHRGDGWLHKVRVLYLLPLLRKPVHLDEFLDAIG